MLTTIIHQRLRVWTMSGNLSAHRTGIPIGRPLSNKIRRNFWQVYSRHAKQSAVMENRHCKASLSPASVNIFAAPTVASRKTMHRYPILFACPSPLQILTLWSNLSAWFFARRTVFIGTAITVQVGSPNWPRECRHSRRFWSSNYNGFK